MNSSLTLPLILLASLTVATSPAAAAQGQVTRRINESASGAEADFESQNPAISDDGKVAAFLSKAGNLVPGAGRFSLDLFIVELDTNSIELVSRDANGDPSGTVYFGSSPKLSADGRYVVFVDEEPLIPADTNTFRDVYLFDRTTGVMELVSVTSGGAVANGTSRDPDISGDGRYVVYSSDASNLVAGDTNNRTDCFLRDRQLGTTERISLTYLGGQSSGFCDYPTVSDDGRRIAFYGTADDLVPGDTNFLSDLFLRDRSQFSTTRISVSSTGQQSMGGSALTSQISADGVKIAFQSSANNLVPNDTNGDNDIFVHNIRDLTTRRVSVTSSGEQGDDDSYAESMAAGGRYVGFCSNAGNIAGTPFPGRQGYIHDMETGITRRVGTDPSGALANGQIWRVVVSGDGGAVLLDTAATNLITSGDSGLYDDIYWHDPQNSGPVLTAKNFVAGAVGTVEVSGATPNGTVVLGYSLAGQALTPVVFGFVNLANPIQTLNMTADGAGDASVSNSIPLGLQGTEIWLQGVDLGMGYPTTTARPTIQ